MHGVALQVGLLLAQWNLCGYDSCIHLSEETIEGDSAAPWAMVTSVAAASVLGLFNLIALLFAVQSVDELFNPDSVTGGSGVAQVRETTRGVLGRRSRWLSFPFPGLP